MHLELNSQKLLSVLLYLLIFVFLFVAIRAEHRDVKCEEYKSSKCGPGMGTAYAAGKPHPGDSLKVLLQKIRITARYEVNSIIWRRAFIVAVIASFLVLYTTGKKLPSGFKFAVAFLIIYIVLYLVLTGFQKVISQPALNQLDAILSQIKHDSSSQSFSPSPL